MIKYFSKNNLLLGFSVIIKFAALGVSILIARWQNQYFEPELLKDFNVTLGYLAIILGFVNLGIPQIIYKLYTNETDQSKLSDIWTTFFVLRLLSYLLGLIAIFMTFSLSSINNLFLLVGVYTMQFILLADQSYRSVLDSRDKSYRFSATDMIGKVLIVATLYLVINFFDYEGFEINIFIYTSILVYLLMYVVDTAINYEYTKFSRFEIKILKNNVSSLWYLTIPGLFIVTGLDRIFLEYFNIDKFALVGYSNALRILDAAIIFPSILTPTLASRLKVTTLNATSFQKNRKMSKYLSALLLIGLLYAGAIGFFAPIIFEIVDPAKLYVNYSLQVIWFFCGYIFLYFFTFFNQQLNYIKHREKGEFKLNTITYFTFIALFILTIPSYGILGAAFTFFFGILVNLIIRIIVFKFDI
ncbi:MAG: hypothetical protein AAGF07_04630 [Patescibacteria group bacterium]